MDDHLLKVSSESQQLEKPETTWWKYSGFYDFLSVLAICFITLCFALKLQAGWLIGGLLTFAAFQFLKAKVRENSKEKTFTEVITGIAALITGFVVLVFGAIATFTYVGVVALLAWQALIAITSFFYRFWVKSKIEEEYDEDYLNVPEGSANNSLLIKTGFMALGFIGLSIFAALTFFAPFEYAGIITLAFVAPLVIATFFGFTGDPYAEVDKFLSSEAEKGTLNESIPDSISTKYVTHPDEAKTNQWKKNYSSFDVVNHTAVREGILQLIKSGTVQQWQDALKGDNAEQNYHVLIWYFNKPTAKVIYQLITDSTQDNNNFAQVKQKYFADFVATHDDKGELIKPAESIATAIVEFKNP